MSLLMAGQTALLRRKMTIFKKMPSGFYQVSAVLVCFLLFGATALEAARYVVEPGTPGGTNTGDYTDWSIAATQIQWAVDVATNGETAWVTNGTYTLTNQITITRDHFR